MTQAVYKIVISFVNLVVVEHVINLPQSNIILYLNVKDLLCMYQTNSCVQNVQIAKHMCDRFR